MDGYIDKEVALRRGRAGRGRRNGILEIKRLKETM